MRYTRYTVRIRFVSTCTRYASPSLARAIVSDLLVLTWDASGEQEIKRNAVQGRLGRNGKRSKLMCRL